jgi:hypothetical protein
VRRIFFAVAVVWLVSVRAFAGSITLGGEGTIDSQALNATMNSDVSTTTPVLTSNSVSLTWNGIVTWTGTRGTTTQKMERDHFLEFDVNFPTQISGLTCAGDYKWVNGGGSLTDPTSKSFANAEIYQYIDSNNNGHFDPGSETTFSVPFSAGTPLFTVTGNGFGHKTATLMDSTAYVLGPGTHYILVAEILDTSSFTSANSGDPDNVYTAEFPTPSFNGIQVSFNYVAVPEPSGLIWVAGTCLLVRRKRGELRKAMKNKGKSR